MKNMKRKMLLAGFLLSALILTGSLYGKGVTQAEGQETDKTLSQSQAQIDYERMEKRTKFTKQFALSDGSFLAVSYSMPAHYKKNGRWNEIDTTMKKTGKKTQYKTKSTELTIRAAVSNRLKKKPQTLVSLKRGSAGLSFQLINEKQRKVKAIVSNPKKKKATDVLSENKVRYSGIIKNTNLIYDIYPERITERIVVKKKEKKVPSFTFKLSIGSLKVKEKAGRLYFNTKKGTTKYKRMKTILTDSKGVSTTKVRVKYNKKTKKLTIKPDKKWWNSKKRKFPVTIRTSYITEKHEREVQVGAAYAGAPDSNFTYDTALLSQAGVCTPFVKMTDLPELKNPNVKIRQAGLYVTNEETLKMGAGKVFDIGVHRVTEKWNGKTLSYQKRPAYETEMSSAFSVQKKGLVRCDITNLVKQWYQDVPNYGMALVAGNANGTYQARLGRNPYIAIHYEVVGFDGAVELKENQEIVRDVTKERQENYYYFDTKPGIAYEVSATSDLDTQGTLYDENKERLCFDDNSGEGNNFSFVGNFDGRRFLKVMTKNAAVGHYTLLLKQRFEIPVVTGETMADGYRLTWQPIEHAREYVVTVYDESRVVTKAVTTTPVYEYVYTEKTRGKTLAFTVTPRESEALTGEASLRIFNTNPSSGWKYETPMKTARAAFSQAVLDEKIYVLGGETEEKGVSCKTMEVYDMKLGTWRGAASYPGGETGLCYAKMIPVGDEIYVFGGQSDTTENAKLTKEVYSYHPSTDTWTKRADMPENRTGIIATKCQEKIYVFSKIGTTKQLDIYNPKTDIWEPSIPSADTSRIINAVTVNNRIFLLQAKPSEDMGEEIYWQEYLPNEDDYEEAGKSCPFSSASDYTQTAVVNGIVYMVSSGCTDHVISYDISRDVWNKTSVFNMKKTVSGFAASKDMLYSIGGNVSGFGTVPVVESLVVSDMALVRRIDVTAGENYEIQLYAGNELKNMVYTVTITIDPKVLAFCMPSSFTSEEEFREGKDGAKLVKYEPDKGVMVIEMDGKMETGEATQVLQSIPVQGLISQRTEIFMKADKEE